MINLNIDDIQQNLPRFIKLIQEGNHLIITQANRPIALLPPLDSFIRFFTFWRSLRQWLFLSLVVRSSANFLSYCFYLAV